MKVIISGHSSFYIRENWINKLFYKVYEKDINKKIDKSFFSKNNLSVAIDTLGVGSKMVESIKYWIDILGIIEKNGDDLELSENSKIIFQLDPYLENLNSLWLLHSNILTKKNEKVLIWDLVFKNQENNSFSKESLEKKAELFCIENRIKYSKKTLEDTINVFIKTYLKDEKTLNNPEENMVSPFVKLNYLKQAGGVYKFINVNRESISDYLIYYLLFKKIKNQGLINQLSVIDAYDYVNKIIRISYLDFEKIVQELELQDEIHVDRAAGLQNITLDIKKYLEKDIIKKILESELLQ
ncbi:DUF4007 family protein [Cetobacterium somerae]|uniref:DUF4007 family protein n=1 Tax=Cetobacterium sp. NK01 TaxID=2993530 RepID=UPI0021163CEE|nr:DUF4007 family protein [Cetobacterium sp. NK01]MCQ8211201.1 DUF4007 family protein [Cetobacterium sp. NK01]